MEKSAEEKRTEQLAWIVAHPQRDEKGRFVKGHIGYKEHKTRTIICLTCGKQFTGRKERKYCSQECYYESEMGNARGKGHKQIPWNKGLKGYTNNGSFKKGHANWNANWKGKKHTKQTRAKMSEHKKELVANGWKPWNVGFGDYIAGENNPRWKGGRDDYRGPNWSIQRRKALQRDRHMYQSCGSNNGKLDVHHIVPFEEYGLENYVEANRLQNLITLCVNCHIHLEATQ